MLPFPIYVVEKESETLPDDAICYLITSKGLYLKKKVGMVESLTPVKNISMLGDVQSYGRLEIPKIPAKMMAQTANFFKKVYEEYRSEAIVLLFFNQITQQYKIAVPFQEVGPGALDYVKNIQHEGFEVMCSIHSHGSMSAFHSGTDDHDEESFDGLHITLGNVGNDDASFSISSSIVINGERFITEATDYIEGIEKMPEHEPVKPVAKPYVAPQPKIINPLVNTPDCEKNGGTEANKKPVVETDVNAYYRNLYAGLTNREPVQSQMSLYGDMYGDWDDYGYGGSTYGMSGNAHSAAGGYTRTTNSYGGQKYFIKVTRKRDSECPKSWMNFVSRKVYTPVVGTVSKGKSIGYTWPGSKMPAGVVRPLAGNAKQTTKHGVVTKENEAYYRELNACGQCPFNDFKVDSNLEMLISQVIEELEVQGLTASMEDVVDATMHISGMGQSADDAELNELKGGTK